MSTDTHTAIVARVVKAHDSSPERFMRFYHAVERMVASMPEETSLCLTDHFSGKSIPLVKDIVWLFLFAVRNNHDCFYEYIEDGVTLRRKASLKAAERASRKNA